MTTMLILIVLKLGAVQGIFLGDFDSPNACHEAVQYASVDPSVAALAQDAEAAGLLCVPRPEA